jgi:hypothetical protein
MVAAAKTIWSGKLGKLDLGIVLYQGIYHSKADGKVVAQAASEEEAKRLLYGEVGKLGSKYFGFEGAKQRFQSFFPDGFDSLRYDEAERNYKVTAKEKLDANVPLEVAANGHGDGRAVMNAISDLNLLEPRFEAPRFSEMLRSSHGHAFLASVARFTMKPSQPELSALAQLLKPYPMLRWAPVTLLPFLWPTSIFSLSQRLRKTLLNALVIPMPTFTNQAFPSAFMRACLTLEESRRRNWPIWPPVMV